MSDLATNNADPASQSLDHFFDKHSPVTLNNCDREPVHQTGSIQNQGALLLVDTESKRVVSVSENIESLLGLKSLPQVNQPLEEIFPGLVEALADPGLDRSTTRNELLNFEYSTDKRVFSAVFHQNKGYDYVEFVPESLVSSQMLRQKLQVSRRDSAGIMNATTYDEALQLAADSVKRLTGFARVKVYQFLPDGSGKVVAEARDEHLPGYMGLHFPATDIPKQARFLFTMVPYRMISSVHDDNAVLQPAESPNGDPIDLSWSLLRSVSTMHTKYLRNMKHVEASFSVSLMSDGELWGLIACHHDQSTFLSFDLCGLAKDLGNVLMIKIRQLREQARTLMYKKMRDVEKEVGKIIHQRKSLDEALGDFLPTLQSFMNADGFAFKFGDEVYTTGQTPPLTFIFDLIEWASGQEAEDRTLVTDALHREWPAARPFIDTACGVLVEPIMAHRVCHLIWFRGPINQTLQWAGNPNAKYGTEGAEGEREIHPRSSFDLFVEQHKERSLSWTYAEVCVAREILRNMLDILSSHALLLQMNQDIKTFSYAAAHDLKTPLRHIKLVLDFITEDLDESISDGLKAMIEKASSSSERLQKLVDQLIDYRKLDVTKAELVNVDLNHILENVKLLLELPIKESRADIQASVLPIVPGREELLTSLFVNLLTNAIKYGHPERVPVITIDWAQEKNSIRLAFTDNGIGIDPAFATHIFTPFNRLHSNDEIEGNGLGLFICKRIIELLNGEIQLVANHSPGARFEVLLPLNVGAMLEAADVSF